MININIGWQCMDSLNCDKCKKCKYRAKWYRLHNLSVNIHRFFEYRLHVKLPNLIYISQKWGRFSGTDKCPFHKSRNYTCFDCRYINITDDYSRECICKERNETPHEERPVVKNEWDKPCYYFEKSEWADDYGTYGRMFKK